MKTITRFSIYCLMLVSTALQAQGITTLSAGGARTLSFKAEVDSVFVSNQKVADYQVIDAHKVVLLGKSEGEASFIVFDRDGSELINQTLIVSKSYRNIEQQIQVQYPYSDVQVNGIGSNVVLSGIAPSDNERDNIYTLVGELLGKSSSNHDFEMPELDSSTDDLQVDFMSRPTYQGVVNNIEVTATKQVNVKLTIAEVSHSFIQDFGIKMGSGGDVGIFVDQLTSFSADDIVSVISAVGSDKVGQVLAEPNLSVISGEQASFLVGGEMPVVTVVDGASDVDYKEFGVRLDLMAKVLRDDKIKLALSPEVSSLDNTYTSEVFDLPAFKTRRAQTTVELGDGQSFVLGGLLNSEERESLTRIPFIGDIPVLGALFRHTGTERNKTELIIVATVNLVKPVKANQIQLPTMEKTGTLRRFFALDGSYDKAQDQWAGEVLNAGGFRQ
ncbi:MULTISPECIES: type II and III secretion system protein family protein [unclassified Vibrio]|uniref:type II and III secretion system protein family protein n=1 Tax=unclassified Vibrio TaxID=2614977 RepID=UPI000C839EC6|nr:MULTISPECIES: pilus assembly protein N-terminal domain-containing protein [unclassified Vibrio]MCX2790800.1 pilus assembly protein N-terminal domain-containing protein [Vibrio sp. Sgm 5]PMO37468.1 general secretion pathway protein GspD [Vibrio sp. 10N.222.52.B12]